jgi:hypothetical protein
MQESDPYTQKAYDLLRSDRELIDDALSAKTERPSAVARTLSLQTGMHPADGFKYTQMALSRIRKEAIGLVLKVFAENPNLLAEALLREQHKDRRPLHIEAYLDHLPLSECRVVVAEAIRELTQHYHNVQRTEFAEAEAAE